MKIPNDFQYFIVWTQFQFYIFLYVCFFLSFLMLYNSVASKNLFLFQFNLMISLNIEYKAT